MIVKHAGTFLTTARWRFELQRPPPCVFLIRRRLHRTNSEKGYALRSLADEHGPLLPNIFDYGRSRRRMQTDCNSSLTRSVIACLQVNFRAAVRNGENAERYEKLTGLSGRRRKLCSRGRLRERAVLNLVTATDWVYANSSFRGGI